MDHRVAMILAGKKARVRNEYSHKNARRELPYPLDCAYSCGEGIAPEQLCGSLALGKHQVGSDC